MKLRLQIRNFKSIESAELCLNPGLNILVGPNGAGKTCLLSALKFVRDVFRLGAAQALARSGGTRHLYNRGHSEIRFSIWQDYGERTYRRRKYPCQVLWEVAIAQRGPEKIATIVEENLKIAHGTDLQRPVRYCGQPSQSETHQDTHQCLLPSRGGTRPVFRMGIRGAKSEQDAVVRALRVVSLSCAQEYPGESGQVSISHGCVVR